MSPSSKPNMAGKADSGDWSASQGPLSITNRSAVRPKSSISASRNLERGTSLRVSSAQTRNPTRARDRMPILNRCRTSWEHAIASCDTVGAWRHCATEKAMRDGHSWILAVSADGCLQVIEIPRTDFLEPKNRIWIGGSLTHLTHITHRIFGISYASCSWSSNAWASAPDHDHESARAAYLRGPLARFVSRLPLS
jgi:hypothetical protein